MMRSFSIEDCGLGINKEAAEALVRISPASLKYMCILPRYAGNVSNFLPSAGQPYLTDEAIVVINRFRDSCDRVVLFTRRDPVRHRSVMFVKVAMPEVSDSCGLDLNQASNGPQPAMSTFWPLAFDISNMAPCSDLSSLFGIVIDSGASGSAFYSSLVAKGELAAFRMYMDSHLLPYSYFRNYEAYK